MGIGIVERFKRLLEILSSLEPEKNLSGRHLLVYLYIAITAQDLRTQAKHHTCFCFGRNPGSVVNAALNETEWGEISAQRKFYITGLLTRITEAHALAKFVADTASKTEGSL